MHPKNKLERRKLARRSHRDEDIAQIAIKKEEATAKKKWIKLGDLKEVIDEQASYQTR